MDKQYIKRYYDNQAKEYADVYKDNYEGYPANQIRLELIVKHLKEKNIKTVLDCGCGTCGPMIRLLNEGFDVKGFDFSEEMVNQGKEELKKSDYDPELVFLGDIEDPFQVFGSFDSAIALGVFPHLSNAQKALSNIEKRLNPKGSVFIEFRNGLFSLFSFNKYTYEFLFNKLMDISPLPEEARREITNYFYGRLEMDEWKPNEYGNTGANFHNPLTIGPWLFNPCGFTIEKIHFYHYHGLPPMFEKKYPKEFRELSLKMEDPDDWRGYFMASAFVVEARKDD